MPRLINTQKCTCECGRYSYHCNLRAHRNIAREIASVFPMSLQEQEMRIRKRGVGKRSYRRKDWNVATSELGLKIERGLCRIMDSKALNNALLLVVLGFLVITIAAQLQMRFVDKQKANAVKVQALKLKEQNSTLATQVKILKNTNSELLGEGSKLPYVRYGE